MKTYFIIVHERRGFYMEQRISAQTGKPAPRFTFPRDPKRFDTRKAAQDVIDVNGLRRCSVREITEGDSHGPT